MDAIYIFTIKIMTSFQILSTSKHGKNILFLNTVSNALQSNLPYYIRTQHTQIMLKQAEKIALKCRAKFIVLYFSPG